MANIEELARECEKADEGFILVTFPKDMETIEARGDKQLTLTRLTSSYGADVHGKVMMATALASGIMNYCQHAKMSPHIFLGALGIGVRHLMEEDDPEKLPASEVAED